MSKVLLTSSECPPCKTIKESLRGTDIEVEVTIIDIIDLDAQYYLDKYPIRGVPALIDEEVLYMGLDEEVLYMGLDDIMERLGLL